MSIPYADKYKVMYQHVPGGMVINCYFADRRRSLYYYTGQVSQGHYQLHRLSPVHDTLGVRTRLDNT